MKGYCKGRTPVSFKALEAKGLWGFMLADAGSIGALWGLYIIGSCMDLHGFGGLTPLL